MVCRKWSGHEKCRHRSFFAEDAGRRQKFVTASTTITHTDPRATIAAMAVAETAALLTLDRADEILPMLPKIADNEEWRLICRKLADAHAAGLSLGEFADSMGLERGVSGYAFHTVPVAIYAVLSHPNSFKSALVAALDCWGDTDSVGAIAGALMGASVGSGGLPGEWLHSIAEWPLTINVLTRLAVELSAPLGVGKPVRHFWPGIIPRNLVFLAIILLHGFRRLLPPY